MGRLGNDTLDLVPACPLCIARMLVDSPNILTDFRLDRFQQKVIDGVQRVRKDELRPS